MKILITEDQLRTLTEVYTHHELTDNSSNIGLGGTMALIGVKSVPTEEKLEEELPLDSSCPSGCYCNGGDCVKVVIVPNETPKTVSCDKSCTTTPSDTTGGGKTVQGNPSKIRRSDSDRLRRRPYSPKARFRAS